MKNTYEVIIIGAGMGGLSCGAWLNHMGLKVLVIEQNVQVGGCCSSYQRNGFNFTPPPHPSLPAQQKKTVYSNA